MSSPEQSVSPCSGSNDHTKWNPKPTKETHIWWSQRAKTKDDCPRCNAADEEAFVMTTETTHMMYGIVYQRRCKVCNWSWTLRIAEDPD